MIYTYLLNLNINLLTNTQEGFGLGQFLQITLQSDNEYLISLSISMSNRPHLIHNHSFLVIQLSRELWSRDMRILTALECKCNISILRNTPIPLCKGIGALSEEVTKAKEDCIGNFS